MKSLGKRTSAFTINLLRRRVVQKRPVFLVPSLRQLDRRTRPSGQQAFGLQLRVYSYRNKVVE
jgi:hypothetical protein